MTPERATTFLKALGAKGITQRPGWVLAQCPFAPIKHASGEDNHPSFAIRTADDQEPFFTCFSCHSHGTVFELIEHLRFYFGKGQTRYNFGVATEVLYSEVEIVNYPMVEDIFKLESKPLKDFPEDWLDEFPSAADIPVAFAYLQSRGISMKVIIALDLKFDVYNYRVLFPIREFNGLLMGARGRSLDPNDSVRYYDYRWNGLSNTKYVWLGENRINFKDPLFIVEGNFDYARVFHHNTNVVASLSSGVSKVKLSRIKGAWKVLVFSDNDSAGNDLYLQVLKGMGKTSVVERVVYEGKDPGCLDDNYLSSIINSYK